MEHRKRLLFLSALYPLPVRSGTQARVVQLLHRLSRRFDVTFLNLLQGPGIVPDVEQIQKACGRLVLVVPDNKKSPLHRGLYKALYWTRRLAQAECADRFYTMMPSVSRAIRNELHRGPYDVLFFSYWFWSPWVYEAPGFKVIDTNDVHWERQAFALRERGNRLERLFQKRFLGRYQASELKALNAADLVVSVTEKDRKIFAAHTDPRVQHLVVPTGIDTAHFAPSRSAPDLREIVFYGALRNLMNIDALDYLVTEILPAIRERLPDVRLKIVGATPPVEIERLVAGDPAIQLTGYVEDVRVPLATAGLVVLPLRFGYGIRGRVFELFAMGLPVVATPVAVEGMGLESGDGLLLADSPEDFAQAVTEVLQDPTLREKLGRKGRTLAQERFSLEATYDRFVDILDERTSQLPVAGP